MTARSPVVLVTGGSGVIGAALLTALADAPGDHRVIALRRQRPVGPCAAAVTGDVSAPLLGLDPAAYRRLCAEVDVVVHAAAETTFSRRADHRPVNVGGTAQVVRFAADADAALVHVSTAYAAEGLSSVEEPSGYEASKREAERLVGEAPGPVTVVRPSIVAGDSVTGAIAEMQGLHLVLASVMLDRVPVCAGEPAGFVDFVPTDHVAAVLQGLVLGDPSRWPELVWVTQGSAALSGAQVISAAEDHAARCGAPVEPVRWMAHEMVGRLFLPVFMPTLPPDRQKLIRALLRYARYLNIERAFPRADAALAPFGVGPPPDPAVVLERNLAWLWDVVIAAERERSA